MIPKTINALILAALILLATAASGGIAWLVSGGLVHH